MPFKFHCKRLASTKTVRRLFSTLRTETADRSRFVVFSVQRHEISSDATRFPVSKYRLLQQHLVENGVLSENQFEFEPQYVSVPDDLQLAHSIEYIEDYLLGTLSDKAMRRIGIQWSNAAVERSLRVVGATCAAAEQAMRCGGSANLAGGQHHAHRDFGSGFCVFNDQVIAAERLRRNGMIKRWLSMDLDVHQGDGTASITQHWDHVFTFSMHGKKNFPHQKAQSSWDVELEDGADDNTYLNTLDSCLTELKRRTRGGLLKFDLIAFQAGVDVLGTDNLGRLDLSIEGCRMRDELLFRFARDVGSVPVVVNIGGGYHKRSLEHDHDKSGLSALVQAHSNTVKELKKYVEGA